MSSKQQLHINFSTWFKEIEAIRIRGGLLRSYVKKDKVYTVFFPDKDEIPLIFPGVYCQRGGAPDGSAYQLNGVIRVGEDPMYRFDIGLLIHEYGHYLQQRRLGFLAYLIYAGLGSLLGRLFPHKNYYRIFSEADASRRGNRYLLHRYPTCLYRAPHNTTGCNRRII